MQIFISILIIVFYFSWLKLFKKESFKGNRYRLAGVTLLNPLFSSLLIKAAFDEKLSMLTFIVATIALIITIPKMYKIMAEFIINDLTHFED